MKKPPGPRIHGVPVWVLLIAVYLILPIYTAVAMLTGWQSWRQLLVLVIAEAAFLIVLARGIFGYERLQEWAHRASPWVQIVAFIVLASIVGDAKGEMQFYSVTAQLIPVLVLALIVQTRAFSLKGRHVTEDIWGVLLAIVALAAGETTALLALFRGAPTEAGPITGAIGAALAGLLLNALVPRESDPRRKDCG